MQKWEEIPENEKAFQLRLMEVLCALHAWCGWLHFKVEMEVELTNKGMVNSVLTHKNG